MGNGSNGQKIPVATVLRVEKLQEGFDEKLPVAVPIRIDEAQGVLISYDEELSIDISNSFWYKIREYFMDKANAHGFEFIDMHVI